MASASLIRLFTARTAFSTACSVSAVTISHVMSPVPLGSGDCNVMVQFAPVCRAMSFTAANFFPTTDPARSLVTRTRAVICILRLGKPSISDT